MSWKKLQQDLAAQSYIASDELAMAVYLATEQQRPLLLEGAAGVGKTEISRQLASIHDTRLIRLQCYEGLDASTSIYEWNYQKQLLRVQAARESTASDIESQIFSADYLLKRPLLEAITQSQAPVLLIDEIDRADEEFEAYLLEVLSDYQVSIPELGTVTATSKPIVVLTSNGSRDLSDALRRRCFYTYVEYPDFKTELAILQARIPHIDSTLAQQIVGFVQSLRKEELEKNPGVAEMLDWAAALSGLGISKLSDNPVELQATLVCLLKTQVDQYSMPREVTERLVGKVVA